MHARRRARFEALLGERRDEALQALESATAALELIASSRDNAGGDDEHDPEGVPLSAEWARLHALMTDAQARIREVDEAFARLQSDEYGMCDSCHQEIPLARLEIVPFARLCVPCASKR